MGLFGRKQHDLAIDGIPGTARIVTCDLIEHWGDDADDDRGPLAEFGLGWAPYRLTLEVTLDDGRTPYTVEGKFRVPVKHDIADVGIVVPVRADPDDPTKVELDWQSGDEVEGFNPSRDAARRATTPDGIYENFPAASRRQMIDGWVRAANGGQMSRQDFDQAIDDAVAGGILDAADAAAARSSLES